MRKERQAILHLVAAGRLTCAEAERLLIVTDATREWDWLAMMAVVLCLASRLPFGRLLHEFLPGLFPALRAAASALSSFWGGTI